MIAQVLSFGWPGAQWTMQGQDFGSLVWHSANPQPKPDWDDIQAKMVEYNEHRQKHYAFNQDISAGFTVQPEGFTLRLEDVDRAAFAQMLALIKEALELGMITSETPQLIADHAGTRHEVTTLRFRQIMVAYGLHYKSLWDALTA